MFLSDRTIKEYMASGKLIISPPDHRLIQPASVDIRLGRHFIKPEEGPESKSYDCFLLRPGQFALGTTLEYVEIPDDLLADLKGKSTLGRLGLMIHSTAGYIDPGFKGNIVLEFSNVSTIPIPLYPDMLIGQLTFSLLTTPVDRPYGSEGLNSHYQNQRGVVASKRDDV